MKKLLLFITLFLYSMGSLAADKIINFEVQNKIGTKQTPSVYFEVKVNKTRDFHIAVQDLNHGSKKVTAKVTRITKAGKYHLDMPVDNLKPGKYKWIGYLTPKGKDWNSRLGQQADRVMEVVDKPVYKKQIAFSQADAIQAVIWPKNITDNAQHFLQIKYQITQPRDILIKLLNANNWKKLGEIRLPVTQPGTLKLPIYNVLKDNGKGKFAWVAFVVKKGSEKQVGKKNGRPFTIK